LIKSESRKSTKRGTRFPGVWHRRVTSSYSGACLGSWALRNGAYMNELRDHIRSHCLPNSAGARMLAGCPQAACFTAVQTPQHFDFCGREKSVIPTPTQVQRHGLYHVWRSITMFGRGYRQLRAGTALRACFVGEGGGGCSQKPHGIDREFPCRVALWDFNRSNPASSQS